MPPKAHNQYDFIMQEEKKKKGPSLPSFNGDATKQKLFIAGGLLGVLILFMLLMVFISGMGKEDKNVYLKLLRQQTEILRVISLSGTTGGQVSQDTRNADATIAAVITSDKKILTTVLAEKNTTFKAKDIAQSANPETDARLAQAKSAANFNSVYIDVLKEQLVEYQNTVQGTQEIARSKSVKDTLANSAAHAENLREQLEAIQP